MKAVLWIVGILAGLALALGVAQYVASERVEVVELHTTNTAGEVQTTRLWIVDHDGYQYLRGDTGSGWYVRMAQNGTFQLTRNNEMMDYTLTLRPGKVDTINQLMRDKYTWGDELIELMIGGRESALAIELNPVTVE